MTDLAFFSRYVWPQAHRLGPPLLETTEHLIPLHGNYMKQELSTSLQ